MRYSNFDLRVDQGSDGLQIQARRENGEEASLQDAVPPFVTQISPSKNGDLSGSTREVQISGGIAPKEAREIGSELFRTVFRRRVRDLWSAELAQAKEKRKGVRLRLRLSSELWDWPWESLFDEYQGFLIHFTDPPISIVRYTEEITPPPPLRGVLRIRILVVAAQPRGPGKLEVEEEWKELQLGLARLRRLGLVYLERLEGPPTLSRLEDRLASGRFHVVHFIGHGGPGSPGTRVVFFEDKEGGADPVDGVRLGGVLKAFPSLRLVVLNACEGARDGAVPFAGVAQGLIRQQIPAVIAMKNSIHDQDAILFSRRFYSGLARGRSVEHALSRALTGLLAAKGESSSPVLYLRVPDGRIFPPVPIATVLLSLLLAGVVVAGWPPKDHADKPYPGPPRPTLPATASTEGCPRSDLLGMPFVRIPEGTFTMGSKPRDREELEHEVTISKPFCMSVYEATRGQWRKIMGAAPGKAGLSDDLPVTEVSWKDTQKFLRRLNQREPGAGYRLASEAEWEYAARGGSPTDFSFGDDPDELYLHGNCKSENLPDGHDGLALVGSYRPNPWGLYDMHGNVSEWVQDWYAPYTGKPETDPEGPMAGAERVRRGGSFEITPKNCSAALRNYSKPGYGAEDVGFRLVRRVQP
ncbi:MAG: SUMF1/EgtB/PvdO family nonheme iron enzyme [Thermoanaerobaculia bacterium]